MSEKTNYFVHESSYVDDGVKVGCKHKNMAFFSHIPIWRRIGKSCILGQNVNIGNNVIIGNNVKIQNNVSIYEGVEIHDYVFLWTIYCIHKYFKTKI